MKTKIILLTVSIIVVGVLGYLWHSKSEISNGYVTIGILQSASHPALDEAREGFIETVKKALDHKVNFVIRNAQGSIANIQTIAQSFHAHDEINAIFAIATPAAQAIAAVEKQKPIFIAAVTDPEQLNAHSNTNICGGSDQINIPATIAMMQQLLPNIKTVSLLSHTGDDNSEKELVEIEQELKKAGLISIRIGFTAEADVPAAIISACGKGDVILTPNYNIIASSMPFVSSIAVKHKKPLIACYPAAVQQGALAAQGINYFVNGEQAGACAIQVLMHNKKPNQLPIEQQTGSTVINKKVADELGIQIPAALSAAIEKDLP